MSLRKIFNLSEAGLGTADTDPAPGKSGLSRFFQGKQKAGQGPISNGVPTPVGRPEPLKPGVPDVGEPIDQADTAQVSYSSQTIPNQRPNSGGTGTPPKQAGAFSRPPNAPPEEPLPDLPLEGSIKSLYGLHMTETQRKAPISGPPRLTEIFNIDEMPRPPGSYGKPVMAMLQWAKDNGGREFTARDLFRVWRQAGGQPNQGDDRKAYMSFQTSLRQFIDQRGRGTPEQPLITTVAGKAGRQGAAAVYRWGAARPSQTVAGGPRAQPGAYDDMELGPAGAPGSGGPVSTSDEDPPQDEPEQDPELDQEPQAEPEEEPSEDEMDWIPETGDPDEPGVSGAMGRMREEMPDKLEELLMSAFEAKDTDDAGFKALAIVGRNKPRTRDAILIAKQVALNLGRPSND